MKSPLVTDHSSAATHHLAIPDGEVVLYSKVLQGVQHDRLFQTLLTDAHWQQHWITLYGRKVATPRLSAWYGDADAVYSYSGLRLEPLPWITPLREIKTIVEGLAATCFNSVLLNLYRDGQDSMGWHSDAEPELGQNPVIASVSLGAVRRFVLQHKKARLRIPLDLPAGSVLIMKGATQHHWRHALPKTRRPVGRRVSLTFRVIRRAV